MTPKEKAIELLGKFNFTHNKVTGKFLFHQTLNESKRCALIVVEELLSETEEIDGMRIINNPYWLEVKNEICDFGKELKLKDIQI
jgi:hypothetical protein